MWLGFKIIYNKSFLRPTSICKNNSCVQNCLHLSGFDCAMALYSCPQSYERTTNQSSSLDPMSAWSCSYASTHFIVEYSSRSPATITTPSSPKLWVLPESHHGNTWHQSWVSLEAYSAGNLHSNAQKHVTLHWASNWISCAFDGVNLLLWTTSSLHLAIFNHVSI